MKNEGLDALLGFYLSAAEFGGGEAATSDAHLARLLTKVYVGGGADGQTTTG